MPGAMLDATTEGASLEYQTVDGRNQQWLDYGLALYLDAVEAAYRWTTWWPPAPGSPPTPAPLTSLDTPATGPTTED